VAPAATGSSVQEYAESEPMKNTTLKNLRTLWTVLLLALLGGLPAAAQSFPISTNFYGSVTWTNATGNRLQLVRVVLSLTAAQANTGRIYTLSTTTTNLVAEKADSAFRAMLWPSATSTVYVYHGDRIRATVSTTNRAFLTIDALPVDANTITNITESDPIWIATKTGGTEIAIGASADAGAGGAAYGWQATGYNQGAAFGVLADGAGGQGAAFGRSANANNSGAAVGYAALGANSGAAVGNTAKGRYGGVAVGYSAIGTNYGTAVGYTAEAAGIGNVALGGSNDSTNRAYVPPTFTDTVELGRGAAISNGWLHFRGIPIVSPAGVVRGAGGTFTNISIAGASNYPAALTFWPGTGVTLQAASSGLVIHASATGGGGDMGTLSNWVGAIAPLSSNAVQRAGDTMTGALTVPSIYGVTATTQLLISAGGGVANSTLRLRGGSDTAEGGPVIIEVGDDTIDTWGFFRVEMPNSEGSLFSVDQYGATFHGLRLTNTIFEGDGSGLTNLSVSGGESVTTSVFAACDWYGFRRDTTNDNLGVAIGSALDVLTATNNESYYAAATTSTANQNGHALATIIVPLGHGGTTTTNLALYAKTTQLTTGAVVFVMADVWGRVGYTQDVTTSRSTILIPWVGILTNLRAGDRIGIDYDVALRSTNAANVRLLGFDRTVRFER
jgi:hypothetical protein